MADTADPRPDVGMVTAAAAPARQPPVQFLHALPALLRVQAEPRPWVTCVMIAGGQVGRLSLCSWLLYTTVKMLRRRRSVPRLGVFR